MSSKPSIPPWFETAFRAEYLEVYAHRDQASARAEVGFLLGQGLCGKERTRLLAMVVLRVEGANWRA